MDLKTYLKTECPVDLSYIAERMFEGTKNPRVQLSMKLKGVRPWTAKNEAKALEILHALGIELTNLK